MVDKKKLLEALAEDDGQKPIIAVVDKAMTKMTDQFKWMAEAFLRQEKETALQFQNILTNVHSHHQQTLDRLLAIVDARTYATVAREARRTRSAVGPWPRPTSSSDPAGQSAPGFDDDVDMGDDDEDTKRPASQKLDEEVLLAGQNVIKAPDAFIPRK